jgi:hypothetical protein
MAVMDHRGQDSFDFGNRGSGVQISPYQSCITFWEQASLHAPGSLRDANERRYALRRNLLGG